MKKAALLLLLILLFSDAAPGQQWAKYIPKNKRKELVKEAIRGTGFGALLSGKGAIAIWVTESAARVLVSQAIDAERITPEEAEMLFATLRPKDAILFLIDVGYVSVGSRAGKYDDDLLSENEIFLQRAEDSKQFSKGRVTDPIDLHLNGLFGMYKLTSAHRVNFSKQMRDGANLIHSLNDKLEIQFVIDGKKVVFDYELKKLGSQPSDL